MALYYSPEKGLTQDRNAKGATILFSPHDEKGFKTIQATVPDSEITIEVHSNFHYGQKSHLYSIMYYGNKIVPNFCDTNLNIPFQFLSVNVNTEGWDVLFKKIINQYENLHTGEKDIDSYFDALDKLIKGEDLSNSDTLFESKRQGQLLLALRRLAEIAAMIDNTIFFSSKILSQRLTNSSIFLVRTILKNSDLVKKKCNNDREEEEEDLTSVFQYLHREKSIIDILLELTKE